MIHIQSQTLRDYINLKQTTKQLNSQRVRYNDKMKSPYNLQTTASISTVTTLTLYDFDWIETHSINFESHWNPSLNPARLMTEHINTSIGRVPFEGIVFLPVVWFNPSD